MKTKHLIDALVACNNGDIQFTNQSLRAFSIGGKWYPLTAVINFVAARAGLTHRNTNQCEALLHRLKIYPPAKVVKFTRRKPSDMSYEEQVLEAQKIQRAIIN